MPAALIALGSNLGDRAAALQQAGVLLSSAPHTTLVRSGPVVETAAIGGPAGQLAYLNSAALIETTLAPEPLLDELQRIEAQLGRLRADRWGPRTIDLDLLLYGDLVFATSRLTVPHPRMAWRRFVIEPAAAIAPKWRHPTIGWTLSALARHLREARNYVAITGAIGAGKSRLAADLAQVGAGRLLAEQLDLPRLEAFYAEPAQRAWSTELSFLTARAEALSRSSAVWSHPSAVVSDFWFDQSLAFARAWLTAERLVAYEAEFQRRRVDVVPPKLLVLLDAPLEELRRRIRQRGRECEQRLTAHELAPIRDEVQRLASQPGVGPVMRLTGVSPDAAREEVMAAIAAMR